MNPEIDKKDKVISAIANRYSPSKFTDKSINREQLELLFEAARWAPSSFNEQPWFFIIATQEMPSAFERLLELLNPGNRAWAQSAPVLILVVAKMYFSRNQKPNPHAWYDVGQAVANFSIQATSMGLVLHQMGGFDGPRSREVLKIPEGFEPVVMVALGYPEEPLAISTTIPHVSRKKRTRRQIEEFVFTGHWGNTF